MKLCLNFMQFIEWQSHHLTYDYAIGIGCMKQGNFFSQLIKPAQVSLPNKNESMKTKHWSLAGVWKKQGYFCDGEIDQKIIDTLFNQNPF